MKAISIITLMLFVSCSGITPEPSHHETRAHRESNDTTTSGIVIVLESDSMTEDTTTIHFNAEEWNEENQEVTLN